MAKKNVKPDIPEDAAPILSPSVNGDDQKAAMEAMEARIGHTPNQWASFFGEGDQYPTSVKHRLLNAPKTLAEAMVMGRMKPEEAKDIAVILAREDSTLTGYVNTPKMVKSWLTGTIGIYGLARTESVMAQTNIMMSTEKWWQKGAKRLGFGRKDKDYAPQMVQSDGQ